MEQAEETECHADMRSKTVNHLGRDRTIFSNDRRNLIVNFAYKLDDGETTEKLAKYLPESSSQ